MRCGVFPLCRRTIFTSILWPGAGVIAVWSLSKSAAFFNIPSRHVSGTLILSATDSTLTEILELDNSGVVRLGMMEEHSLEPSWHESCMSVTDNDCIFDRYLVRYWVVVIENHLFSGTCEVLVLRAKLILSTTYNCSLHLLLLLRDHLFDFVFQSKNEELTYVTKSQWFINAIRQSQDSQIPGACSSCNQPSSVPHSSLTGRSIVDIHLVDGKPVKKPFKIWRAGGVKVVSFHLKCWKSSVSTAFTIPSS